MKELGAYLGLPIFLLLSTWGAFSTIVDMTERLNKIRNAALGLTEADRAIPIELRRELFRSDWIPLWIGVIASVAVLALIFFLIPALFKAMHKNARGEQAAGANALMQPAFLGLTHIKVACYGLGLLSTFACIGVFLAGLQDLQTVKAKALPSKPVQPNLLESGHKYQVSIGGSKSILSVAEVSRSGWVRAVVEGGRPSTPIWVNTVALTTVREIDPASPDLRATPDGVHHR